MITSDARAPGPVCDDTTNKPFKGSGGSLLGPVTLRYLCKSNCGRESHFTDNISYTKATPTSTTTVSPSVKSPTSQNITRAHSCEREDTSIYDSFKILLWFGSCAVLKVDSGGRRRARTLSILRDGNSFATELRRRRVSPLNAMVTRVYIIDG